MGDLGGWPMMYPKPGTVMTGWWEEGSSHHVGPVLILDNSRTRSDPFSGDVLAVLSGAWSDYDPGQKVFGFRSLRWWSVTKGEIERGEHHLCDEIHGPGEWCSYGSGIAWVDIAFPVLAHIAHGQGCQ